MGEKKSKDDRKKKSGPVKKSDSGPGKVSVKLTEHTAMKNKDEKQSPKRQAVWVKKETLAYEEELNRLQIELLKMQGWVRAEGQRILLLFEGRDAAGKGGTIKRFTEHLNPRGARVVALGKPSDTERTQWYFQRYVSQLPSAGEMVFFDRSWYNRAMVEPVMDFCSDEQNKRFLKDVPLFEQMLVKDGIRLFKFYFSVSKAVQKKRFDSREGDLLKQYKISPVDQEAQNRWDAYTIRKFQMLSESNRTVAPWTIIRSDNKKLARLNCIKCVLNLLEYPGKSRETPFKVDPDIVVSGIDELKLMEDSLMSHKREMPG